MSGLQDPLDQHRKHVADSLKAASGMSLVLVRYLKDAYDRAVRGFMVTLDSSPDASSDRFPVSGDPDTAPGLSDYARPRPDPSSSRVEGETSRRNRVADIPPSLEDHRAWAAGSDGQAWQRHLDSTMPADIKAALDTPQGRERLFRTDEMRERLRDEMLERQQQGEPMTVGEYEDRFVDGVVDVARQLHRARADLPDVSSRDRGPRAVDLVTDPVFDLHTVDQMQSKGERWTAAYEKGYDALRDEVVDRASRGRPMGSQEYEDRLEYLTDQDMSRPVDVPPALAELQQWRAGPEARAERAELHAYADAKGFECRDIDQDKFDAAYEQLRSDVVDRQEAGDPMSAREYCRRHEHALVDAGQHWKAADWQTARADLRSIGEAPSTDLFDRNPPAGQLRPVEELELRGDRFSDQFKEQYQALCDETSGLTAEGRRMPDAELERRIDAIHDADGDRAAAIPPALAELAEWRESPAGRAEAAELKVHGMRDQQLAEPDRGSSAFDQQRFDDSYAKLRDEMVDRKAAGDPMSDREFGRRYQDAAVDAGQSVPIARWEAQRLQLRVAGRDARDEPERDDREGSSAPEHASPASSRSDDFERRFGHLAATPLISSGDRVGVDRPAPQTLGDASVQQRRPTVDR